MSERAERIKRTVQMVDVLDAVGYAYSLHADRTHQIRCPVHDDRDPSARYYHEQQTIHCFTCGRTWNVITLVQKLHGCSFEAAMDWLEDQFPAVETAQTLSQQIRARVRQHHQQQAAPNLAILFSTTEQRLIARRRMLGLETYSKRLIALDLTRHRHGLRQMSDEDALAVLQKVLA